MPYYDFYCPECGAEITAKRAYKERRIAPLCPACDDEGKTVTMKRKYTIVGIIYRGGGWGGKRGRDEEDVL